MHIILVVEDEPDIREVVCIILDDAGHKGVAVENGAEALSALDEVRPDAIISNVVMPVMDGNELYKELQAHPVYSSIPIVLLSATPNDVNLDDCRPAAVIAKPFDVEEVLAVASAVLGNRDTGSQPQL